jgi:hypothetical protein
VNELKRVCGLYEQNNLLCDPVTAEDKGVYWVERRNHDHCAIIHVPDRAMAQRILKFCKSRAPRLQGKLLRVDVQVCALVCMCLHVYTRILVLHACVCKLHVQSILLSGCASSLAYRSCF